MRAHVCLLSEQACLTKAHDEPAEVAKEKAKPAKSLGKNCASTECLASPITSMKTRAVEIHGNEEVF